jgi:hypothetical protein
VGGWSAAKVAPAPKVGVGKSDPALRLLDDSSMLQLLLLLLLFDGSMGSK